MPTRTLMFIALVLAPWSARTAELSMPGHYAWFGAHVSQYWPYHEEIGANFPRQITLPGLQTGYRHPSGWSLQGTWERNNVQYHNTNRELRVHNSWISLRHHIPGSTYEPYVGLNAGDLVLESPRDRNDETLIGLEAGVQTRVTPHWVVDLGARVPKSVDNERVDIQAWIGLNHVFGIGTTGKAKDSAQRNQPEPETQSASEQQSLRDSDRDGVPDERDQCPDTGAGRDVDDAGCATLP